MKKRAKKSVPEQMSSSVHLTAKYLDASESPVYETTGPYDPTMWENQVPVKNASTKENSYQVEKCSELWAPDMANARPMAADILEPIRQALRSKGWLQVNARRSEAALTDEAKKMLFGDGLEILERTLGRLVLDAIFMRNTAFPKSVDHAIKDADALFHRGTSRGGLLSEAFFCWWHEMPAEERTKMTIGKLKERFEKTLERGTPLSPKEWALLKDNHPELQAIPEAQAGRPRKSAAKKVP